MAVRREITSDWDADHDEHSVVSTGAEREAAGVKAVRVSLQRGLEQMGRRPHRRGADPAEPAAGFDCPGCAWPEEHGGRKLAEFCENGAKAVAEEATKRVVDAGLLRPAPGRRTAPPDPSTGCRSRAGSPIRWSCGRATTHYEPIDWDDAYRLIADELRALDRPDEAVFYTSGRTSNEAAFLYQLLVRSFGTNNLPDCSNMCHESSGTALADAIGIGKGSVTVEDLTKADLILIAGQNPGTNHPRMLSVLEKAKANGAKIIAINPLPEAGLIRFKDPQKVHGVVGRRRPDRGRVRPDPARRRHGPVRGARPTAPRGRRPRAGHRRRPRLHRRALRRASPTTRPAPAQSTWTPSLEATGLDREQLERRRADARRLRAHRRLLGDGPDPAPARGRDHRRDRQRAADARHDRQARRRAVPGARALQRAGRPHDGHLGEDARGVPGRARRPVRHRQPRASTGSTPSTRSGRCATAGPRCSSAMGGNFAVGHPGHRGHRGGAAAVLPDRAGLDEAQPQPPRARVRPR